MLAKPNDGMEWRGGGRDGWRDGNGWREEWEWMEGGRGMEGGMEGWMDGAVTRVIG